MPAKKKEAVEKASLEELLKITQQHVGKGNRVLMGDDPKLKMATITSGIPELDRIIGGGWRCGRFAMIVGEASMGKTLLTQRAIVSFQALGKTCAFIDPERTFDGEWFGKTGVDVSKLIVLRPNSTEQAFDVACEWVENGIDLVVIDSLAALTPLRRMENTLVDQNQMGLNAAKIGEGIQKLNNTNMDSMIIFTNQMRSKIGIVYGNPESIPGGMAQKFYATYIVHVRRGGWLLDGKAKIGMEIKMTTDKNKLAPPQQEAITQFMFTGLFDSIGGLIELIKEFDVIPHLAGRYQWEDEKFHGAEEFHKFLDANPHVVDELREMVEKAMDAEPDPDVWEETEMTEEELSKWES